MSASNGKTTGSILASGLIASTVAPGAVYCSEKFLPEQMTWLKKRLADHVILPQLRHFETLSKGLDKAHEKYDLKKREEALRRGEPVADIPSYTPQQRAYFIADALVKASVALAVDFGATYALLKWPNKLTGIGSRAGETTFVDATVTLGCIALFPTVLAEFSENVHHGFRRLIQKITGMDKESADKIALSGTYVGLPGLIGTAAGIITARR